ncbi:hypothetical protein ACLQ28_03195 [Micromonospora sp. DT201]|uniref:hypothetical protein n=1 Tax=Micromonospora sp. DT201 TaxID=3393442 RepID=UPI003CF469EB
MSNGDPDWVARGTALLSLLVALVGLGWQWYSWRRNGPHLYIRAASEAAGPLTIAVFNRGRADVEIGLISVQWKTDQVRPWGPFVYRPKATHGLSVDILPFTIKAGHSAAFQFKRKELPESFIDCVWSLRFAYAVVYTPVRIFKGRVEISAEPIEAVFKLHQRSKASDDLNLQRGGTSVNPVGDGSATEGPSIGS